MGWTRRVELHCDRCGEWTHSGELLEWCPRPTVRAVRCAAQVSGWRVSGGEDVCPECAAQEEEE